MKPSSDQRMLVNILESAMDAIITVDHAQCIVLFNRAAEQMFECRAEDAIGGPLDRFIPTRFRSAHREHIKAFERSGTTSRRMGALGEVRALTARGEEFPVEAAISQAAVEGNTYFTVILRDTRERERLKRELEEREALLRTIIETEPECVTVLAMDGTIQRLNAAGVAMLEAENGEQLLGKPVLGFVAADYRAAFAHLLSRAAEGEACLLEFEATGLRGSKRWLETHAVALPNAQRTVAGILAVTRDVTQRKRLQEQLRRTERVAELGTLASGMAHEIGTPMNVILGRAEYLMNRTTDEPVKRGLQTIISQVERITRVMNQLLSFARRRPPERRAVSIRDTVEGSLEMFHERLAQHQITVELDYDPACPMVQADPDQMSQVMINLLVNAVHAMPGGGRVRIATRRLESNMVEVTIADSGTGIPSDIIQKIFDPFFTTKEFGAGTGLGLTVVKGIMEEHGGTISVTSEPGRGTIFTLALPESTPPPAA